MKKQTEHSISLEKLNKKGFSIRVQLAKLVHSFKKKRHQPGRDRHGRFVTGHGGHSEHKKFNWHMSLAIALVVALTGGFLVFQSFAAGKVVNLQNAPAITTCGYQTFLNRKPDSSGMKYWSERYQKASYNPKVIASGLLNSKEGQFVAYTTTFDSFIQRMYTACLGRKASKSDVTTWANAHLKGTSRQDIFNFVLQSGARPAVKPTDEICKKFTKKGSSVKPLCRIGSDGSTKNASVENLPESNIYINKAWRANIEKLRTEAAKSRFYIEANDNHSVAQALKKAFPRGRTPSPGSFRSWDEQNWLWQSPNFSANRPGNSMHEWGLAVDLKCNGSSIINNRACWQWVRSNGPRYGVYNFKSVKKITDVEAWHFSSNGE